MNKIIALLILTSNLCLAQSTISGKVLDSTEKGVPNLNITLEQVGTERIIDYAISDSKGNYAIEFNSELDSLILRVSGLTIKENVKKISNSNQIINFIVETEVVELDEVVLRASLITKIGDTIAYDINSFINKNDRVLSDVLKKMPGIEVAKNGTIFYNGEAINNFYVNGKDLMEGGYGVINNSMPLEAVSKVEILENHQSVEMLRDKVPSEYAAVNVRLKSTITITGRAEIGAGLTPVIWNTKLTPMIFTKKYQAIINYKANNTGEAVEQEGKQLTLGTRFEGLRDSVSDTRMLSVEKALIPSIPEKKYLLNNVHFMSGNFLTSLKKKWEFKGNVSYANNAVERNSYSELVFTQGDIANQKVIRNIENDFYTNEFKSEIIFTKNTKNSFFKNITSFDRFRNSSGAAVNREILSTGIDAKESVHNPKSNFQNSLSLIVPWKDKILNFISKVGYVKDNQILNISPAEYLTFNSFEQSPVEFDPSLQLIKQTVNRNTLTINHATNVGFSFKNWMIITELGIYYSSNNLTSEMDGLSVDANIGDNDELGNNLDYEKSMPYVSVDFNINRPSWFIKINTPFKFYGIESKDSLNNTNSSLDEIVFEPNLFAKYDFASYWKVSLRSGISTVFGNENSLFGGYILTSPTTLSTTNSENVLSRSKNQYLSPKIEFRNPLNSLFFNLRYNYLSQNLNQIVNLITDGVSYLQEIRNINNKVTSSRISFEIGKYFRSLKTNTSISYAAGTHKSEILFNGNLLKNNTGRQRVNFKLNNATFEWMSLDYNSSIIWDEQTNNLTRNETGSFGWTNNLSINLYPFENHSLGFNWNQYNYKLEGDNFRNAFIDLNYQFTSAKSKIDFELQWLNILNTDSFERIFIMPTFTSIDKVWIRPSQILFTLKFNFR